MASRTSLCSFMLVFMIMVASTVSRNIPPSSSTTQGTTITSKMAWITRVVVTRVTTYHVVARKVQAYNTASSGPSDRGPDVRFDSKQVRKTKALPVVIVSTIADPPSQLPM
ncbi:hypothetical protein QVD17_06524 [Tagetes erecta]|uniref:Secreted protein n=1 Tax=Tagetes erecta TaxID=13708 RepID=A0AAD8LNK5_TARER|nr:hypothetical protein QVD17_06524 [Tagetes erecta]